jgi:hypothetical protein
MELSFLADEILRLHEQIRLAIVDAQLDDFQANAFKFVFNRLKEMESECRDGLLKPAELRYPELSRIAVEVDPSVLPVELGARLIELERQYQKA